MKHCKFAVGDVVTLDDNWVDVLKSDLPFSLSDSYEVVAVRCPWDDMWWGIQVKGDRCFRVECVFKFAEGPW